MFSNSQIDSPPRANQGPDGLHKQKKASSTGTRSFDALTSKHKRNDLEESKSPQSKLQKRKRLGDVDATESVSLGDSTTVPADNLEQSAQNSFNGQPPAVKELPGVEERIQFRVEQPMAATSVSSEPGPPRFIADAWGDNPSPIRDTAVHAKSPADTGDAKQTSLDQMILQESDAAKSATTFVKKAWIQQAKVDPSSSEIGRVVTRQVSEALIHEIPSIENDGLRRLTLKLHPAELGKLTLYVGWENETVKAQIVASELATSEMLNRDKDLLMDTMHANGFEFESFDVSYEGSTQKRSDSKAGQILAASKHESNHLEQASTIMTFGAQGSVVNIIA